MGFYCGSVFYGIYKKNGRHQDICLVIFSPMNQIEY